MARINHRDVGDHPEPIADGRLVVIQEGNVSRVFGKDSSWLLVWNIFILFGFLFNIFEIPIAMFFTEDVYSDEYQVSHRLYADRSRPNYQLDHHHSTSGQFTYSSTQYGVSEDGISHLRPEGNNQQLSWTVNGSRSYWPHCAHYLRLCRF